MQIELTSESEILLKELIAARKKSIPDYCTSMTVIGNAMIQIAAVKALQRRKSQVKGLNVKLYPNCKVETKCVHPKA